MRKLLRSWKRAGDVAEDGEHKQEQDDDEYEASRVMSQAISPEETNEALLDLSAGAHEQPAHRSNAGGIQAARKHLHFEGGGEGDHARVAIGGGGGDPLATPVDEKKQPKGVMRPEKTEKNGDWKAAGIVPIIARE